MTLNRMNLTILKPIPSDGLQEVKITQQWTLVIFNVSKYTPQTVFVSFLEKFGEAVEISTTPKPDRYNHVVYVVRYQEEKSMWRAAKSMFWRKGFGSDDSLRLAFPSVTDETNQPVPLPAEYIYNENTSNGENTTLRIILDSNAVTLSDLVAFYQQGDRTIVNAHLEAASQKNPKPYFLVEFARREDAREVIKWYGGRTHLSSAQFGSRIEFAGDKFLRFMLNKKSEKTTDELEHLVTDTPH